jgi:hypothetical protein
MPGERRRHERATVTGKLHVERLCGECGRRHAVPVYLRDISAGGFSGTYFGRNQFGTKHMFYAVSPTGGAHRLELVWSQSTLDTVHMLGFKVREQDSPSSTLDAFVIPVPTSDDALAG